MIGSQEVQETGQRLMINDTLQQERNINQNIEEVRLSGIWNITALLETDSIISHSQGYMVS